MNYLDRSNSKLSVLLFSYTFDRAVTFQLRPVNGSNYLSTTPGDSPYGQTGPKFLKPAFNDPYITDYTQVAEARMTEVEASGTPACKVLDSTDGTCPLQCGDYFYWIANEGAARAPKWFVSTVDGVVKGQISPAANDVAKFVPIIVPA
jgi:hypothetical protein